MPDADPLLKCTRPKTRTTTLSFVPFNLLTDLKTLAHGASLQHEVTRPIVDTILATLFSSNTVARAFWSLAYESESIRDRPAMAHELEMA